MTELDSIPSISSEEFSVLLESGQVNILDIRESDELAITSLPNSIHIPMMELEDNVDELSVSLQPYNLPTVVVCRSGARSEVVTEFLIDLGFKNIHNLSDGINGLSKVRSGLRSY